MILTHIKLHNFRNYPNASFSFSPSYTFIQGKNAIGKTSLLEGIYVSLYGTGFRQSTEKELICWEEAQGYVETAFIQDDLQTKFQISLQRKENNRVQKTYFIDKTDKSAREYQTMQSDAVLFAPEDIRTIHGSPKRRRDYFDTFLSHIDFGYKKALRNYTNALRKRNKILEMVEDEDQLEVEISFWNDYMINHANIITSRRQEYADYLNKHNELQQKHFFVQYRPSRFDQEHLDSYWKREKLLRRTLSGPQKDDISFFLEDKNVQLFGSRSEQRLTLFWLKFQELHYIESIKKTKPLLLLDDIFSELDEDNKELILEIAKNHQTIITTTENNLNGIVSSHYQKILLPSI